MSDLLPSNASSQERAIADATERVGNVPATVRNVWNADTCPSDLLAWLAWAFSVDEWDPNWTDDQKRGAIKYSIGVHRHKGTIGAVRKALAAIGVDAVVQEWFNQVPAGDPYTFRIMISADQIGAQQSALQGILAVLERTKNLRSHMDKVQVIAKTQAGPTVAAVTGLGSNIRVTNYVWAPTIFNETNICF